MSQLDARDVLADDPALRAVLAHDVNTPLAALHAALEDLSRALATDDATAAVLARALAGIDEVERAADALVAFATPAPLQPLRCSLREVTRSAWLTLAEEVRERVWLAQETDPGELVTDGPLLARRLGCLLTDATRRGPGEVLFHAHVDDEVAYFAIVAVSAGPAAPTLEALLARRDLARLGAEVSVRGSNPRHTCLTIRMPSAAAGGVR
jgi:signal transduction histidine kinase